MDVTVTTEELAGLRDRLALFASTDDPDLSRLLVHATGGRVEWTATDSVRLARLAAGRGDGDGTFTVPVRTLTLASHMAERREAHEVHFVVDGNRGLLRLPGVELPFDASAADYPDMEDHIAGGEPDGGTSVTVAAEDLLAVIYGANLPPPWLEDDDREGFVLSVDAERGILRAVASWNGHADTAAVVACRASASTRLGVNPGFLYDLAAAAGEDTLTLLLPPSPRIPLRVRTEDGFVALLMPVRIGVESARPAFEAMLAELLEVGADDLERDDDGDYPIPVGDEHAMYLRLADGDPDEGTPDTVTVFALLATGVEASTELLAEINDLNRNVRFARLFWAEGNVLVGDELLLSTLDAAELGHACRTVARLAARVAPMLQMVHGR